jgi:hypothetical protein
MHWFSKLSPVSAITIGVVVIFLFGVALLYGEINLGLPPHEARDLGTSLLGGAVAAFAVLALEVGLERRENEREDEKLKVYKDLATWVLGNNLFPFARTVDPEISTSPVTPQQVDHLTKRVEALTEAANPGQARTLSIPMAIYMDAVIRRSKVLLQNLTSDPTLFAAVMTHADLCTFHRERWSTATGPADALARYKAIQEILRSHKELLRLNPYDIGMSIPPDA